MKTVNFRFSEEIWAVLDEIYDVLPESVRKIYEKYIDTPNGETLMKIFITNEVTKWVQLGRQERWPVLTIEEIREVFTSNERVKNFQKRYQEK